MNEFRGQVRILFTLDLTVKFIFIWTVRTHPNKVMIKLTWQMNRKTSDDLQRLMSFDQAMSFTIPN